MTAAVNDVETLTGQIVDRIVDRLSASVISSSLPAEIGDWIRETCKSGQLTWMHNIPMQPHGYSMAQRWTLNPDGTMGLELWDMNAHPFWRGTFRPAEEAK